MDPVQIFQLIVLIFSVMIHEVSHGLMALRLGDDTAKAAGRLTLNPLKHIDLFGSVILPLLLILSRSPILFGWAKPVPYNPLRLKDPKKGSALIGAAGPMSNIIIALVFGIVLRLIFSFYHIDSAFSFPGRIVLLLNIIVVINILLAVFNLIPIPPLDGASVLFAFLPDHWRAVRIFLSRYGFFLLLVLIFSPLFDFIARPVVFGLYRLFVGPAALF